MKVEKQATNRVGLIILIIVVSIGVIGGGYYLITHKDKLNIDWNFTLPWNKDSGEEEKDNANGKSSSGKKNKNQQITFKGPDILETPQIPYTKNCYVYLDTPEETSKEFIIPYHVEEKTNNTGQTFGCIVEFRRYVADGYEISGSTTTKLAPGESKTGEIKLSKAELESQELSGINNLQIYMADYTYEGTKENQFVANVSFSNNRSVKNEKTGISIDVLNKTAIQYYKTTTDAANTYIYFIADNQSADSANIKVRKLLINDVLLDTKDIDVVVGEKAKRLFYITVPKTKFSNVKKFTVSFFNITTNSNGVTSYLISNEYSRKY